MQLAGSLPNPGIEPRPSAVKVLSPNHWTTGEFPTQARLQNLWRLTLPHNLDHVAYPQIPNVFNQMVVILGLKTGMGC